MMNRIGYEFLKEYVPFKKRDFMIKYNKVELISFPGVHIANERKLPMAKQLQDLTLFDKFLFDETMDVPEAHEAMLQIILGDVSFNLMKDTCFIMITPYDIFGKGLYCYTFYPVCKEDPSLLLNDGTIRIFLNSKGTNTENVSSELIELLHYMESTDSSLAENSANPKLKTIHRHVCKIKSSETMGVKYMQKWEELKENEIKARAEGELMTQIHIIRKMLKLGKQTTEGLSSLLDIPPERTLQILLYLKNFPNKTDLQIVEKMCATEENILPFCIK